MLPGRHPSVPLPGAVQLTHLVPPVVPPGLSTKPTNVQVFPAPPEAPGTMTPLNYRPAFLEGKIQRKRSPLVSTLEVLLEQAMVMSSLLPLTHTPTLLEITVPAPLAKDPSPPQVRLSLWLPPSPSEHLRSVNLTFTNL